jgi:glycerophosphoryl diester phosphodiesterase
VVTSSSRRHWVHRAEDSLRVVGLLLACLVITSCLYLVAHFLLDPNGAEGWTVGRRPTQFLGVIDHEDRVFNDPAYGAVFGVAHNSGGSVEATLEGLIHGADIIEVDVVAVDGVLYSAHDPPLPFIGERWFRGPRLDRIWAASSGADAVALDLKEDSPEFVRLLTEFLEFRTAQRPVIISSRSAPVLETLHQQVPEAVLLMSVPDTPGLEAVVSNDRLLAVIDGVTIRHTVLTDENAAWLNEHQLLIFAWTVDDLRRANELIRMGVDGITSDNLALVSLFGGDASLERTLRPTPILEGQDE